MISVLGELGFLAAGAEMEELTPLQQRSRALEDSSGQTKVQGAVHTSGDGRVGYHL